LLVYLWPRMLGFRSTAIHVGFVVVEQAQLSPQYRGAQSHPIPTIINERRHINLSAFTQ